MFKSLKDDRRPNAIQYLTSLLISLVAHTAVLGVLVVLPLMFFNVLHADELIAFLIDPPSVPVPPPVPVAPAAHRPSAGPTVFKVPFNGPPIVIPHGVIPPDDSAEPLGFEELIQGIGNSAEGTQTGTAIDKLIAVNGPTVLPPIPLSRTRIPIRVSGPIQEAKLIHKVNPVYPEIAIRGRVSGIVTLEAVIDEEGTVSDIKILDGHPFLAAAARDAVKQWKYSPTLIGGEPVQVLATVTVIFRIR
jgi:periplasmic protein TonB